MHCIKLTPRHIQITFIQWPVWFNVFGVFFFCSLFYYLSFFFRVTIFFSFIVCSNRVYSTNYNVTLCIGLTNIIRNLYHNGAFFFCAVVHTESIVSMHEALSKRTTRTINVYWNRSVMQKSIDLLVLCVCVCRCLSEHFCGEKNVAYDLCLPIQWLYRWYFGARVHSIGRSFVCKSQFTMMRIPLYGAVPFWDTLFFLV